ncbi:MAG: magnesium transporter [Myxococcaceae bacterium]|nr:magnesium transporter [Myxococcaceae bacterium]
MSGAAPGADDDVPASAVPLADLSAIDVALKKRDGLKAALGTVRPVDVGRDLSRRHANEAKQIVEAADDRRAATILRAAHPAIAARTLGDLPPERAAKLLTFLQTDQCTAILSQMRDVERERIEAALPAEDKVVLDRLLAHGESCIGRLMTPKLWRVDRTVTAGAALEVLRANKDDIEVAVNCYVTDGKRLVGVVPLRELAVADPAALVDKLMTRDPISVNEETERGAAAEIIQTHDFLSLPVTDKNGDLVGAVRVDDLLDAALEKVGKAGLNQGAVQGNIAAALPYFQTPLSRVVRSRLTWLVLLFVAETLTGTVLRSFEDELAKVVALSFFVPLLIGTGGNAGSQTVSTIIRALALGEVRLGDALRVLLREVSAGLALGLLLGGIAFGRALMWGVGSELAGCVAVTILVVCVWANAVGSMVPLLAQKLEIDPTVVSAPLITTVVDASGLFIYFSVAHLMISQLH